MKDFLETNKSQEIKKANQRSRNVTKDNRNKSL